MSAHTWVLTDVAQRVWQESLQISGKNGPKLASSDTWSVTKSTLHGGLSDGIDLVELDNGSLSLAILPTRGMGIWRGRCQGVELGWKSPAEWPVHPKFVHLQERGGLGWLAGFNEWLCRCGLDVMGPPGTDVLINAQGQESKSELTLHGKIANLPAHRVEVSVSQEDQGTISVTGTVDEAMLFGTAWRLKSTIQTRAGSQRFRVLDEITNLRSGPADFELLYHLNTGRPFLEAGAKLVAPVAEMAPRDFRSAEGIDDYATFAGPQAGFVEQAYYFRLIGNGQNETQVVLKNAAGDKGLSVHFPLATLPWFVQWKNTQAEADGYVCGLEPATTLPNIKTFERQQRRLVTVQPGETYRMWFEIEVHLGSEAVARAEAAVHALQETRPPHVHRQPHPLWSPG